MAGPTKGGDSRPSNPFGNYSFMEAQQTTSAPAGAFGASAEPAAVRQAAKENPFGNYSFKDAQQHGGISAAIEPSSPTDNSSGYHQFNDAIGLANSNNLRDYNTDSAQAGSWRHTQQAPVLRPEDAADRSGHPLDMNDVPYHPQNQYQNQPQQQHGASSGHIEQYAIRVLYEEFRDRAAAKIEQIVELRLDREPELAKYLETGADPAFDRTLDKLGMLARRRPRVIIELLLVWRKATIDISEEYPPEAGAGPAAAGALGDAASAKQPALSRAYYIVKERRSLVSVYILCRALGAVVGQLDASHLEGDLGDRLEELVFGQVKGVNPANLRRSANRREIQDLYAQLIGRISEVRFASMSDRFIAELERIPMVSSGNDERIVVLLHNMRFLKLRVFPIDALEESSAFLLSCAKFYSRTTGSLRLKHAWASLLTELLMPMAAVVDAEVNLPGLVQAIDIIYTKAMKMAAKVRHVTVAFPLAAAALCISRQDVFHQHWLSLLEFCIQRLKDKQFRRVSMDAILRMLWVYLFRYPEANAVVLRRIDSLSRIFFPATKLHAWPKTVPPSAFAYFLTCAACYNFEFAMRQLLKNMLQVDSGWPGTTRDIVEAGPFLDTLNPARVALAFQALVNVAAIASNRPASAASVATDDSSKTGSNGSTAFRPPFPGIAQLSGLDVFDVGVLGTLGLGEAAKNPGGGPSGGSSNIGGHLGNSGAHGGARGGGSLGNSLSVTGGGASSGGAAAASACVPGPGCEATQGLVINPDALPDSIRSALITAIGAVTRYFNVLCPVFGNYVLADERLWRLTRTMPPMSSVVLTGSVFNFGNTVLAQSAAASRDHQGSGSAAAAAAGATGVAGASGSAAGAATAAGMSDETGDGHYHMDGSGSLGNGGTMAHGGSISEGSGGNISGSSPASADAAVNMLRQVVSRYPAERQVYLDLMAVYIRNVPRSRLFWEQTDVTRLIETMVQNVLHVDQTVAAESRACLMDLLCPPSVRQPFGLGPKSVPFARGSDRLGAIIQAVTRATQALRATDERFTEVLVGGIFSHDTRSCVPYARPGDPLPDAPGIWPFGMAQINGGRRFIHAANLSTTSNTSASAVAAAVPVLPLATGDSSSRSYTGTISDHDTREDSAGVRQSLLLDTQSLDGGDSDIEVSAAGASAAGAKSRLHKPSHRSHASAVGELNGGFLHVFLDLIYYLEAALIEDLAENSAKKSNGKPAASSSTKAAVVSAAPVTTTAAAASPEANGGSGDSENGTSLATGSPAASASADTAGPADGTAGLGDARKVAGHSLASWASLLSAIEANSIAYLCSSSVRARHLCVDILYQVGSLRRIIAAHEPLPLPGHTWMFRSSESAYEVLNILVPRKHGSLGQQGDSGVGVIAESTLNAPLVSELWDVPFGAGDEHVGQQKQFRLAKLAASSRESDISMWLSHIPLFIRRACVLIPDVMLVTRTLVCQRLYQMQPLMNQYADISVKASVYGMGAYIKLTSGQRAGDKSVLAPRADLVNAFGNLFLFAVVSLPTGDTALRNIASSGGSVFGDVSNGNRSPHGNGSSIFGSGASSGTNASGNGSGGSGGGGGGRSRLAKSIARKLAPLKSSSRGSKQEQGVGLASIAQLVRMASITLRSDNAPLRQQIAYAFCNTPPAYLQELMQELRPLSESLFDDGSSMASHKNYLHVSSAASSALSNSGLMASLGHGLSSPGGSAQHIGGGASASGGNSPRSAAHQAYRAGSSILAAAQLATHSSSKRRALRAGNSALAREGSVLGSDTEATSDSGNSRQQSASGRGKFDSQQPDGPSAGRRANSFDAATKSQFTGNGPVYGHGDGSVLAGPNGNNAVAIAAATAAAAAAAAAASASTGGSGSVSQMRRRRLRLSLAQIFRQVSRQLDAQDPHGHALYLDEQLMAQLIAYVRETKTFLTESTVQWEWEHQPLRIHICGLVEALYYFISMVEAPTVWLADQHAAARGTTASLGAVGSARTSKKFTHETRNGLYQLFERWCCLGRYSESSRDAQQRIIASALEQTKDGSERAYLNVVLDEERRVLELTSLRAMAVLCRDGQLSMAGDAAMMADRKTVETGGPRERATLFSWISDALDHVSPRLQLIGQRAVEWTIRSDPSDAVMVRVLVQLAYGMPVSKSVDSGFGLAGESPEIGSGSAAGGSDGASINGGAGAAATSGLGLMFGTGDPSALRTSVRHGSGATTAAAAAAVAGSSGSGLSTLSSDRAVLGYLRAITSTVSPALVSSDVTSMREYDLSSGKQLTQKYIGWMLPVVLFQLRSEQHRVRRQALLLLRIMCIHMAVDVSCLYRLDEMGPSIVSDIPAIASNAAARLTEAVAQAFAPHSVVVLMETVRQVHAQSAFGGRFLAFAALAKPWLANVVLHPAAEGYGDAGDDGYADSPAGLGPIALTRDSLLVLQCMLYMTIKAGHDSMSSMQDLWLALVGGSSHGSDSDNRALNTWAIMRYLTGLLIYSRSTALLGFMRRIAVFLMRSSQGSQLVQMLVAETMRPSAAVPLGVSDIPSRNVSTGRVTNEAWSAEIMFLTQSHHSRHHNNQQQQQQQNHQKRRILVSTGGLAMFYLGAISYEQPASLAEYRSLAVLPSTIILLANPERWVRDAARTVLVNLVASERALCTRMCHDSDVVSVLDHGLQANDAAHIVLGILRGDECASGFGNLDDEDLDRDQDHANTHNHHHQQQHVRQDSQFGDDADDSVLHGWSPVSITAGYPDITTHASLEKEQTEELPAVNEGGKGSVRTGGSSIEIADPSLVADVAALSTTLPRSSSPEERIADGRENVSSQALSQTHPGSTARASSTRSVATTIPDMADSASIRRRSSALSRRSPSAEYIGEVGSKDRATLHKFMVQLSRLFGRHYSGCAQEWADVAVQWAMSCPVRPLAGLALQVFSVLAMEAQYGGAVVITPSRQMILRLVDRLSNVVGDPSSDFSAFAETVLAGLWQTAGLAARMCADDEDIKADLLAVSLSLMLTAQSANAYSMALGIFERIFPLVEADELRFRRRVIERAGPLCSGGYQPALLRGLEFSGCRDRCLRLLRNTLGYDAAATASSRLSSTTTHPMLALATHLTSLIDDSLVNASELQRASATSASMPDDSVADEQAAVTRDELENVVPARAVHRHNYRRPRAPSFTANAFGSSLGLMFGSGSGILQNQTADGAGSSLAHTLLQPSSGLGTAARLQLFKRRGHGKHGDGDRDTKSDSLEDVTSTTADSEPELEASPAPASLAADGEPKTPVFASERNLLHDRYLGFITQCSQLMLRPAAAGLDVVDLTDVKETSQLVQRIMCLLAPPAGATAMQYALGMARETIQQFGYAVVECGRRVAMETIGILLQFLSVSHRTRSALKYLQDSQVARILNAFSNGGGNGVCSGGGGGDQVVSSVASGSSAELRRIDLCLQLLLSVLHASDSGHLGIDPAMMPKVRHLLDLVIVAQPISDLASRVLQVLLQRFDDGVAGSAGSEDGRVPWYESDPVILLSVARAALAHVVSRGIGSEDGSEEASSFVISRRTSLSLSPTSSLSSSSSSSSSSVAMPVLVTGNQNDAVDGEYGDLNGNNDDDDDDGLGDDLLAQLDEFDRELDAVLNE
ncbi:Cell morphogenesis protein PAG1 [Coemansia erecta]|uniref:Cell morphogenesis protein PAG1 n=1 Tax=Coemansia erecta TaxID=147472 RepID=A0A9W7Y1D7_9FUNG|nr:Cell morphogenesis protein PAG1 [Coemansia erecta]